VAWLRHSVCIYIIHDTFRAITERAQKVGDVGRTRATALGLRVGWLTTALQGPVVFARYGHLLIQ
jgi:hypothetical protein